MSLGVSEKPNSFYTKLSELPCCVVYRSHVTFNDHRQTHVVIKTLYLASEGNVRGRKRKRFLASSCSVSKTLQLVYELKAQVAANNFENSFNSNAASGNDSSSSVCVSVVRCSLVMCLYAVFSVLLGPEMFPVLKWRLKVIQGHRQWHGSVDDTWVRVDIL